jgi:hypothetical protein
VTDVSDAVQDDVAAPDERTDDKAGPLAARPVRRLRGTVLLAFLATVVAVVASALLPFAPVTVNKPTVSGRATARTGAASATVAATSRRQPSIGTVGMPGSINAIRRRSTTSWSDDAVTATAQPR